MAIKYRNPPVIYVVAKLIFLEAFGNYSDEKYKKLLMALTPLEFSSWAKSKLSGVQVKQSNNEFSAVSASVERIGFFSNNRQKCVMIDENSIELRLSKYTNHNHFLDDVQSIIKICADLGLVQSKTLNEVELHYVDLFVPNNNYSLNQMFSDKISLPMSQFYHEKNDVIKVGITSFTRILESEKRKISISLEHLSIKEHLSRKFLPDALFELDPKLAMPLSIDRLFSSDKINDYAIVHTACGTLLNTVTIDPESLRNHLEEQYVQSRKTFDYMIDSKVCEKIWEIEKF
ncbi:hypothetical protein [Thorsellia anophelis]|uniref:TIGR04255 family protein n=1 Tax=Thorsellia anophelis DSM 18579 TaxID=1123402 RepID=A0A1I0BAQ7_9GAMM|nr:hypothetical protein [Thorsellia anophelis]SET03524.1 TIGR04255 family protein [Thorsellia anophelis DSM 18579]